MTIETRDAQPLAAAPAPPPSPLLRWFPALQSHDFRLLWSASFFSFAGWWMTQLALGWLVLELTNSPFQLGLVSFFSMIPTLGFSIPGGVLADRLDRRRLILLTQGATFALMALLAALVVGNAILVEHIYAISFLTGALMSLNMPARQAIVVEIVRRDILLSAIALNSAIFSVTRIVGPVLAGLLLVRLGNGGAMVVGALFYLSTVLVIAAMQYRRGPAPAHPQSAWRNLIGGIRYSLGHQTILALIALIAVPTLFGMPFMALLPAFARDELGLDAGGLGLLNSAIGLGALVATTSLAVTGSRLRHKGTVLLVSTFAFGLALVALSLVRWFPLAMLVLVVIGVVSFGQMTLTNSLLQMTVPNELRGRVMSLYMLIWGLMPVGTLPIGAVAEMWGTPAALALGGALTSIATVAFAVRMPFLRKMD
ncbi:MAG: MFS transporter [Chloroflexi bacterium]|nr:MFS transporter [Chloroflexota bacterium]